MIEKTFNNLIDELTEKEWEEWCLDWIDKHLWIETYSNWEDDIKEQEIEKLKEIIKNRK